MLAVSFFLDKISVSILLWILIQSPPAAPHSITFDINEVKVCWEKRWHVPAVKVPLGLSF